MWCVFFGENYFAVGKTNRSSHEKHDFFHSQRALQDDSAYLILNAASLDDLNERLRAKGVEPVSVENFRPNFVVEPLEHGMQYAEDAWEEVRIGRAVQLRQYMPCGRCSSVTVNRIDATRMPNYEPMQTLKK